MFIYLSKETANFSWEYYLRVGFWTVLIASGLQLNLNLYYQAWRALDHRFKSTSTWQYSLGVLQVTPRLHLKKSFYPFFLNPRLICSTTIFGHVVISFKFTYVLVEKVCPIWPLIHIINVFKSRRFIYRV